MCVQTSSPTYVKQRPVAPLLELELGFTSEIHSVVTPTVSPNAAASGIFDFKTCDLGSWYDVPGKTGCSPLSARSTNASVLSFDLSAGDEDDHFDRYCSYPEPTAFYIGDDVDNDGAATDKVTCDSTGFDHVEYTGGADDAIIECLSDGRIAEHAQEEDELSELSDLDEDYINMVLNEDSDDDDVLDRKFDDIAYDVDW